MFRNRVDSEGYHYHQCKVCQHVWKHLPRSCTECQKGNIPTGHRPGCHVCPMCHTIHDLTTIEVPCKNY